MALNDKNMSIGGNKGVDIHPGVANPTSHSTHANPLSSNFVTDPTTQERGAGAGANFEGDKEAARNFSQTSGSCEGRPGIIESTNIDPLNENSNKDDGWANDKSTRASNAPGTGSRIASTVEGAANYAYGVATGDHTTKEAGKEAIFGKK
ncbi:hypothetical protein SERLA73DRAFT_186440 [Serpula lacrymans var. lacrymans S7.3]|uniref:Uncharacterized protein n=1 Tax=Serpula lacrymans var. lacrymans (strain S7.3) TaxID=936435 RepID=F8Q7A1_SERL3|nr:hypothetical protein SERLA73DRAFT_186440 [Serpula lacrymans var. lacrymans S7.3]